MKIEFPTANFISLLFQQLVSDANLAVLPAWASLSLRLKKKCSFWHLWKIWKTYPLPIQTYPDLSSTYLSLSKPIQNLSRAPIHRHYPTYLAPIHGTLKTYPALDLRYHQYGEARPTNFLGFLSI
jgi:hypothetical protein